MKIEFFCEEISFVLKEKKKIREWILRVCESENASVTHISFVFCSDNYLLEINKRYLQHDYFTDIITFPYGNKESLTGDIFVSIDRVRENSGMLKIPFYNELHRVIIHGILHLLGYNDKSRQQKVLMREKENACLALLNP